MTEPIEKDPHPLLAENRQLRAEIERLRAAWRWAGPYLESLRGPYYLGADFDLALMRHRRALEDK